MRILFFMIAFAVFISCQEEIYTDNNLEPKISGTAATSIKTPKDIWICHHPESSFHNKVCVEEQYPDGCYVRGDTSKFCWLMLEKDCNKPVGNGIVMACAHAGYIQ